MEFLRNELGLAWRTLGRTASDWAGLQPRPRMPPRSGNSIALAPVRALSARGCARVRFHRNGGVDFAELRLTRIGYAALDTKLLIWIGWHDR